jgi:aromatic-L-amino-acid decarboxylase
MDIPEFRQHAHELVDWMADYLERVADYPVRPRVGPGEILRQLPAKPPSHGEPFEKIFSDFEHLIFPGMMHWQSPRFFGYFPANSSPASVLGEMLTATLGAQCMSWMTSPAATELEERVMEWLRDMVGLPKDFLGVIQDTASTSTLCSLLTAREVKSNFSINREGFPSAPKYTVYASSEAHSSIEKAVKIAGIGRNQLRAIDVNDAYAMIPEALERAVLQDLDSGHSPLAVVAAIGTTGSTAIDPLRAVGEICRRYGVWLHLDAAFAGSALILPEMRWMIDGIEYADSLVFNPHKWLFTNFDCSAYFVKDAKALIQTFEVLPEYLKSTEGGHVNNYRDWGIQLGRRFRALKLWFVIRSFGVGGLEQKLRHHLALAQAQAERIRASSDFELLAPVPLNTLCFRYHPREVHDPEVLNTINAELLEGVNRSGGAFLTHTKLNGRFALRMVIGQTSVQEEHVRDTWRILQQVARQISHPAVSGKGNSRR